MHGSAHATLVGRRSSQRSASTYWVGVSAHTATDCAGNSIHFAVDMPAARVYVVRNDMLAHRHVVGLNRAWRERGWPRVTTPRPFAVPSLTHTVEVNAESAVTGATCGTGAVPSAADMDVFDLEAYEGMGATKIKLGSCKRCGTAPAKGVETLAFGSSRYKLELCESDAAQLRDETEDWSRYGVLEEDAPYALGDCVRCWFNPTPTESLELLALGDITYVLELCDKHADMFLAAMLAWARLGDVDEDSPRFSPAMRRVDPELGPALVGRLHVPQVIHTAKAPAHTAKEDVTAHDHDHPVLDVTPLLTADGWKWTWTAYARRRAADCDVTFEEALWCAESPDSIREGSDGVMIHRRGPITVLVNPDEKTIITVTNARYDKNTKELRNVS